MKLSVSNKLWLLAGISLLGIGAMAVISRMEMARVYTSASYANDNTVPELLVLHEAADHLSQQRTVFWQRLMQSDPSLSAELERRLQSERQATYAALQHLEPLLSDDRDRSLLDADRIALHALDELFDKGQSLAQAGKANEARDFVMASNQSTVRAVFAAFAAHREYNKQLGQNGATTGQQVERTALRIELAGGLIAAMLVLFTSTLIRRICRSTTKITMAQISSLGRPCFGLPRMR